ncbi:MAG: succinate dehydrogenase/fumarate reductase iron-sulfur subunit [Chitinivibrionales bacterium]|nr:succinate dehydrogenase/fumarate reductase iron-sulfur subunit [Chitinivibrionales bacterium]
MAQTIHLKLKVWRRKNAQTKGYFQSIDVDISTNASFLEMLDQVNNNLIEDGREPIAFEHDCREGICGSCDLVINGEPHGPERGTTTCQLHMRKFKDGDTIVVEPFRSAAFPVVKDLVVKRDAFDRIMQAGGFITARVGSAPDGNALPVEKDKVEKSMDAAQCIGCGACVAACPNRSAMLFVAAKASHLSLLPQGQPERKKRALAMVRQMDAEGFGNCSNHYECEAACPKEISVENIARLNRDYLVANIASSEKQVPTK